MYGQLLDRSSLKKIDINLRVYLSQLTFNEIKAQHNMPTDDNTAGFYSHATNQAYLLLANNNSTLRTATHESAHAINRGIIGYSPRWLDVKQIEKITGMLVKGMQKQFNHWTNLRLKAQTI